MDAPPASAAVQPAAAGRLRPRTDTRPFHSVAVAAILGVQGYGGEIATPLGAHLNLRGGAQVAGINAAIKYDGISANGQLSMQNIFASVDYFPLRGGFHISPGVTLHNDTHLSASILIPGGTGFSLGDGNYTSDPRNPVTGLARFKMGNTVAPRLTVGWGNMIPRRGGHFSIPFEAGLQYTSAPVVTLALVGSACDSEGECGEINSNGGSQNIQAEITKLQKNLAPFRIYPLITTGISYRFGRSTRAER